jgi:hypothetical protein
LDKAIAIGKGQAQLKRASLASDQKENSKKSRLAMLKRQKELARKAALRNAAGGGDIYKELKAQNADVRAAAEAYAKELDSRDARIQSGDYKTFGELMEYYSRIRYEKKSRTPVYKTVRALNYDNKSSATDIKIAEVTISQGKIDRAHISKAT